MSCSPASAAAGTSSSCCTTASAFSPLQPRVGSQEAGGLHREGRRFNGWLGGNCWLESGARIGALHTTARPSHMAQRSLHLWQAGACGCCEQSQPGLTTRRPRCSVPAPLAPPAPPSRPRNHLQLPTNPLHVSARCRRKAVGAGEPNSAATAEAPRAVRVRPGLSMEPRTCGHGAALLDRLLLISRCLFCCLGLGCRALLLPPAG